MQGDTFVFFCQRCSNLLIYKAPLMTAFLHEKASRLGISHCEDILFLTNQKKQVK